MSLKMMSKLIVRRELCRSQCRCILPFCYRLDASVKPFVDSAKIQVQRHLTTKCDQKIDNKSNLEENPFYGKYSDKIKTALKDKNRDSVSDSMIKETKLESIPKNFTEDKPIERELNSNKKDRKQRVESLKSKNSLNQSLDDIVKLDLLRDKSAEEIAEIWKDYHKTKDCIFAIIPPEIYDRMFWLSSKYKTFVFPIPRNNKMQTNENNYEFFLSQFVGHKCFFTPLIAYQTHRELAPVCLTVHHFPELQKDKQIVLMLGEYDSNLLNGFEAQCLANQLQWYYSADQNVRQNILLHQFNCEPNLFDHMKVIRELEDHIIPTGMASNVRPK